MIFLSPWMLAGLALIALPVLLHLLNRGRTRPVMWGAMVFLRRSVALRTRRIRFEEAVLLALRCLALALPALAMARPFLSRGGRFPVGAPLSFFLIAAVCLGVAGALWSQRRRRHMLLAVALVLLLAGVAAALSERYRQERRWAFGGGERDWVVIIDGSAAMGLTDADGRTFYDLALAEARDLIRVLRPGDTLAAFVGAAVPVPLLARPTSDPRVIEDAFADVPARIAPGGRFNVAESLNAAVNALAAGRNLAQRIVVFGAGHRAGWMPGDAAAWDFLGGRMDARLRGRPELLYRRLPGPRLPEIRNLAVAPPVLSRSLADLAEPMRIQSEVINTGNRPLSPGRVRLMVNELPADVRAIAADVPPGAVETVTFTHHFTNAGPHVLEVALDIEDDLAVDNRAVRVVHVQDRLPVLIIDGTPPGSRRRRSAAQFLATALAPPPDEPESLFRRLLAVVRGDNGDAPSELAPRTATVENLVRPEVLPITELGSIGDLSAYRVAILVNVPRLPQAFAVRLAEFVRAGHGLWIVPGHLSRPEHFDQWRSASGEPLWPAFPAERIELGNRPLELRVPSFTHPAQRLLAHDPHSDIDAIRVARYWRAVIDPEDPNVRIAGMLLSGDPFMLERSFGQGSVIMSTSMLDREDSNLPALQAFVPLVHETLYYLAASAIPDDSTRPGTAFATLLPFARDSTVNPGGPATASVATPSGRTTTATLAPGLRGLAVHLTDTVEPGLYRLELPAAAAAVVVSNRLAGAILPVAVPADPRAALIEPLTAVEDRWLNEHVKFHLVDSANDLAMVLGDDVPGQALWVWFLLATLGVLLAEPAVSRQITAARLNRTEPVVFDAGLPDSQTFTERVNAWFPSR